MSYLIKLLYLLVFSLVVTYFYYNKFTFHIENFDWYIFYVITILSIYFWYKSINYILLKKEISFTPIKIFWLFLLHILVLSFIFFNLSGQPAILWLGLFFKIIWYMILPIIIILTSLSFWKYLLEKIPEFKTETSIFQFLSSLWVWFFIFTTFLTILWFAWFYNLISVFLIILILLWVSYKQILHILKQIFSYEMKIDDHNYLSDNFFDKLNLKLLTTEFLFIVITFLISVNLINIVRPMPIWWDDLWAYMNIPNLMASAGSIINIWWMMSWQVFSWIWYMFNSATQAFFLNNVWWILSVLVIILSFIDLLKSSKKTFINIPFLAGAIFIAMPMVIFQQAKDMKLDPGLFFVSSIIIYMVLYIFLKYLWYRENEKLKNWKIIVSDEKFWNNETIEVKYEEKKSNSFISYFSKYTHIWENDIFQNKSYLIYILIIWILAWFAFSIKVTTLLLISGIIWIIFYSKLGIAWFISYLSIYIAIFTKAWLWSMMNVVYPKDDMDFRNKVFLYGLALWFGLLAYSINKYSLKAFKWLLVILSLFLVWVWVWLSPWIAKNISTLEWNITISWILGWKWEYFNTDYLKIYSKEELATIKKKFENTEGINASWTTTNEDFWRYFWYEKWVNNYIKLPYNLTMQSNQRWEYTDITYIFLAIVPVIILFLWYKAPILALWTFAFSLLPLFIFFYNPITLTATDFFTKFDLPVWYAILALFFLIPFLYLMYSLNREKTSVLFKLNLVFAVFYIFLWSISAFWIVWYGIAMYYSLLFVIAVGLYHISSYDENTYEKDLTIRFFGSLVLFFVISTYFFNSSFPHWFNNLRQAWYNNFKAGITNNYVTIFDAHWDYFDILTELNIKKDKHKDLIKNTISQVKNEKLKSIITENNIDSLSKLNWLFKELSNAEDKWNIEIKKLKNEVADLRTYLYKTVLYPEKDIKNNIWIYRIWTFLKYFIADNHNRLLEDSLITEFDKYFYSQDNVNIWAERMKKVWVEYFLVDLNAATIDRDPRRDLTRRFENLLKTFTSDNLELITTDSTCLKIALEDYKNSAKTTDDLKKYIDMAWVNYESYDINWNLTKQRWQKQLECYNHILNLIKNNKISETNYPYLLSIQNYLSTNKISNEQELYNFFSNYITHWWLVLFRIK